MMQGDGYGLPFEIWKDEETPVVPGDLEDLQITLGHLTRTWARGELEYDREKNLWIFPLTQQESFSLPSGCVPCQLRLRWVGGSVEGVSLGHIHVEESITREVL